ncbi:Asp23/Gls24 family envelope stress response protein [Amycolatopsis sp. NPDC005961]|uniref:Alkaline shock protein 23 n=1 Tax=Amycolatopsis camponoti TaxID=2606593 RepID=A0A6I8LL54_9PSEU|nr:Asp23/Gls24 family envelope stress response protein [Amycolatopsis camponoti]VVJ17712.1 Alkaline shock protein 23 [Amycolatopsis camponoti]
MAETTTKAPVAAAAKEGGALVTSQGSTTIADTVVQKIAGLATREVPGVHALGGGAARAFSAIRERIPGATASAGQGVSVEVGEKQAAVDLQIVVEYGVSIADVSRAVRRNVITGVEQMTGLEVVEVNIGVGDLHLPDEDDTAGTDTGRVQ